MKFNEFLDEANYVLPRLALGYKGDSIPVFSLPVVKTPPATGTGAAAHRGSIPTIPENSSVQGDTVYVDGSAKRDHTPSPPPAVASGVGHANPSPSDTNGTSHDHLSHLDSRASMGSVDDDSSIISDITHATSDLNPNASAHSLVGGSAARRNSSITSNSGLAKKLSKPRMHRKSVFDTSGMGFNGGAIAGRNMLSGSMLEYIREECVDSATADAVKAESVHNPSILLGWQVCMILFSRLVPYYY